jgi:hypothetical protein
VNGLRRGLRPVLAGCLLFILAQALPGHAQSVLTRIDECNFLMTVKIEIHGDLATEDHAKKMKERFEKQWNGPTDKMAEQLGANLDIEPAKFEGAEGTESLKWQRDKIDKAYDDLRSSLGADGNTCYMPCCTIQFRMEIKVRKATDPASEGFHQIEIMPDYRTEMKDGVEVKVRNRSFILKTANPDPAIAAGSGPDKWVLNGQKASTTGEWREGTENPAESHEIGHLMGLGDKYIETGGHVHGHAHDVMNTNDGFPFESGIEEILKIGGFKCDCCPDPELTDAFMQDLNLLVVAARDAANACNRELLQAALDQLKNKRREVGLVAGMSMQDKVTAAAQLDRQIAELEKALRDCPEEDKTIGVIPGGDLGDLNIATDSNEWCTYGGGDGTFITPIPLGDDPRDAPVPGGDDPRDGPGTPPEGDDPRDGPPPTAGGGDDPKDSPTPGGGDPRDTPTPVGVPVPDGGDDDDPRDTPTPDDDDPRDVPTPIFVKAKAAVIDGSAPAGNAVAGQTIKLLDTGATDVALPGQSPERPDVGYDGDPLQCRTDGNGDCKIEVPPCGETDPSRCPLKPGAGGLAPAGYQVEVFVGPTSGAVLRREAGEGEGDAGVAGGDNGVSADSASVNGNDYLILSGAGLGYDSWKGKLGLDGDWSEQVDYCRDKQPGPPLGWTPADYRPAAPLPSATLTLETSNLETGAAPW